MHLRHSLVYTQVIRGENRPTIHDVAQVSFGTHELAEGLSHRNPLGEELPLRENTMTADLYLP